MNTAPLWVELRTLIAERMTAQGLSLGMMSERTGLLRSTIQGAVRGEADVQWNTAVKLIAAVGLSLAAVAKNGRKGKR